MGRIGFPFIRLAHVGSNVVQGAPFQLLEYQMVRVGGQI